MGWADHRLRAREDNIRRRRCRRRRTRVRFLQHQWGCPVIKTGPDGRRHSVRTAEEDQRAVVDALAILPGDPRSLFEALLSEKDPDKADRLGRELESGLYHTKPVPMEQFIEDPYYLGDSMTTLFPALRELLLEMFNAPYREVLLSGSIGLDSLVQEADGALPTLGERLGRAGDVAVLLDSGQTTSITEPAHHSGIKEALRLTLANGMRVDLTPDHEVRVWRHGEGYCWVPASELVRGDLVVVPRTLRTAPSSDLGVDEAQLLAYWVADGSSSETRARFDDGNPRTSEEVLLLLERLGFHGKRYPIGKCCWEVSVSRVKRSGFLNWLRKYGADRKTADVIVPDAVCRAPDAVVAAFLNRLWACEGCVYAPPTACSPPRFTLGMTSERFIRQVQMLLLRFGVRARIYHVPYVDRRSGAQREIWHLAVSGIDQLQKFVDRIGIILGKEEACARLVAYCETHRGNTNVDLIPIRGRELSMRMTAAGIARTTGTRWWSLASMVRGRMSRQLFEEWVVEFGETELGQELVRAFPVDLAFEPVTSVEPLALAIPVGDVGAHNGNRFLANGINVHNSIGYGKTYLASVAMCRILYELSCLRDPQGTFGVGPGTEMVMMLMSKSLPLCREVLKTAVDDKIKLSPYFMSKFPPKFSTDFTLFPNNIRLTIGSYGAERALGKAIVAAICDETNFPPKRNAQQIQQTMGKQLTAAHFDIVEKVYRSLVRRIKSRFQKVGGDLPGMVILASSAATLDSFTERKIREAATDPDVFVIEHTQWSARPKDFFCGEVFYVLCSKSSLRSRIMDVDEAAGITDEYLTEHEAWMVEVPIEYRDDFESNLEDSLRDIAGVSTQAISAFFQRVEAIDACVVDRTHPFSSEVWIAGGPGNFQWSQMCRKVERRLPGGFTEDAWRPKEYPGTPRWIHVDASVSGDSTGFCMGRIDRWVEVVRRDGDGNRYTDTAPYYVIEVLLSIRPPAGEQIYMPDVRRLVYELQAHGFPIAGFSTDTYQYVEMHQQVRRHGIYTELISVDDSMNPYEELKSAIYESRIEYYAHGVLLNELRALEYDRIKGKVDHPRSKSKDLADALAGVVWGLRQRAARLPWAADADTPKVKVSHEHQWVSPLIPAEEVNVEEIRAAQRSVQDSDLLPPILMGDDD